MKRLTLELDDLRVDTFDPRPRGADRRGTLFGYAYLTETECDSHNVPESGCCGTQTCDTDETICWNGGCAESGDTNCGNASCENVDGRTCAAVASCVYVC